MMRRKEQPNIQPTNIFHHQPKEQNQSFGSHSHYGANNSPKKTNQSGVNMQSQNIKLSQHASQSQNKLLPSQNQINSQYNNPNSSSSKNSSSTKQFSQSQSHKYQQQMSSQNNNKGSLNTSNNLINTKNNNNYSNSSNSLSSNLRQQSTEWIDNIQKQLLERKARLQQNQYDITSPVENEKSARNDANKSPLIKTHALKNNTKPGSREMIENSGHSQNQQRNSAQPQNFKDNKNQASLQQNYKIVERPSYDANNTISHYSSVSSTVSSQNKNNLANNYGKMINNQNDLQGKLSPNSKALFDYQPKDKSQNRKHSTQLALDNLVNQQPLLTNPSILIDEGYQNNQVKVNQMQSPQNIYVQYQYNNFIYGSGSQSNLLQVPNNVNQSQGTINVMNTNDNSNILINNLTLKSPVEGLTTRGGDNMFSQIETPQDLLLSKNLQQHGEYIKVDLLTKMQLDTQNSISKSEFQKALHGNGGYNKQQTTQPQALNIMGQHLLNHSNSQKGLNNDSKNLSEKVSGYNKHKLVVKQKPNASANNQQYGRIVVEQRKDLQMTSERKNSLEKTIGGFFGGAKNFFENMQEKVKKLMPISPKEPLMSARLKERKSIDPNESIHLQRDSLNIIIHNNMNNTSLNYNSRQNAINSHNQAITPQKNSYNSYLNIQRANALNTSSRKRQMEQSYKISSIKPFEKEADDPIEPPSPREMETICLKCQQSIPQGKIAEHQRICTSSQKLSEFSASDNKQNDQYFLEKIEKLKQALDKHVQDIRQNQPNTRDEMYATTIQLYANKFKEDIMKCKSPDVYTQKDYLACKQLIQNIQFQESSGGASTTMLIMIQRLKVLARERLNIIMSYLKENSMFKLDNQSQSSGSEFQRQNRNLSEMRSTAGGGTKSQRDEMSEERFKIKQDEVQKTIKEKEFLQKRTGELLNAMQLKQKKYGLSNTGIATDPNIINKGNFLLSDIRSEVDNQTHVSDNSQKTQTSIFTATSNQQSTVSNVLRNMFGQRSANQAQDNSNMVRSASNNRMGDGIDEIDETVKIEESKREKEQKQNTKMQIIIQFISQSFFSLFYEMCFKIKNTMFPDNHLAKYANIPALYEESQKKGILTAKYQDFIYNELSKNAQLWVSMKEINQIRRKNQNSTNTNSSQHQISTVSSHSSRSRDAKDSRSQHQLQESEHQLQLQQQRAKKNNNLFVESMNSGSNRRQLHSAGSSSGTSKNRIGSNAKIVKIETIMEEDDAQLSMYND